MQEALKRCTKCKSIKSVNDFYIQYKDPIKYYPSCKGCVSKYDTAKCRALREKGMCVDCEIRPAVDGKWRCITCAGKSAAGTARRRQKDRDDHTCQRCHKQLDGKSRKFCNICNEQARQQIRISRYGITEGEVLSMLETQLDRCAICACSLKGKKLFVDHHHDCSLGKRTSVRGILCYNCNTGLGSFKENLSLFGDGVIRRYLEKHLKLHNLKTRKPKR